MESIKLKRISIIGIRWCVLFSVYEEEHDGKKAKTELEKRDTYNLLPILTLGGSQLMLL